MMAERNEKISQWVLTSRGAVLNIKGVDSWIIEEETGNLWLYDEEKGEDFIEAEFTAGSWSAVFDFRPEVYENNL